MPYPTVKSLLDATIAERPLVNLLSTDWLVVQPISGLPAFKTRLDSVASFTMQYGLVPLSAPAGSAAAPGVAVGAANKGLYSSGTDEVSMAISGALLATWSVFGITVRRTGGAPSQFILIGEASTSLYVQRYSSNTNPPIIHLTKAGGTIAAPTVVLTGYIAGELDFDAYDGANVQTAAFLRTTVTETTPGPTAMGSRVIMSICATGSVSPTELPGWDHASGYSMFGSVVIDQTRIFRPRPYTIATLPAATTTGIIHVSDLMGGPGLCESDGTNWRRVGDIAAIASSSVTAFGLFSRMTSNPNYALRELIWNVYQKLSDSGLFTKLKGLWVHALPTQEDALRNWITPGTRDLTITGIPVFTANQGFTGAASGLLSTGANLTVFGTTQDDTAVGTYVLAASAANAAVIGVSGGATRRVYLQSGSGSLVNRLNDTTNSAWTPARYTGMFTLSRTGAANYGAYLDDALSATIAVASNSLGTAITFLGTVDATGSEFSTAKIAFSFISTGLSATDVANLRSIMVDYFLARVGAITQSVANLPAASNFQSYVDAPLYLADLGGGAGHVRSNGSAWVRENIAGYATVATDADFSLQVLVNAVNIRHTGTLTAIRTVTISTVGAYPGAEFYMARTGAGAFNLVFAGKNLATGQWARAVFDGTAWYLAAFGSL